MSWGALAPIPRTPSGICNCSGLGSGEVGLEGVPDGYRAMDQRLSKADRSSSEEVRFGGAQGVDPHGRSANWTDLAWWRSGNTRIYVRSEPRRDRRAGTCPLGPQCHHRSLGASDYVLTAEMCPVSSRVASFTVSGLS